MPSSGRENLGWAIRNKDIGVQAANRGRTDVVSAGELSVARPLIFLDIAIDGAPVGRLVCELYVDQVPRTAENFRSLCTGSRGDGKRGKPLHYKGCPFHRIVPNLMVQSGDITHGDGTGGESMFGQTFPDESLQLQHGVPGILSMANSGKNTNGSQFFITTKACPHLDGKHVVFGKVVEGLELVYRIESCGSPGGKPLRRVIIDDCGMLRGWRADAAETGPVESGALNLRPAKRKRASDAPTEVRVVHILKKHAGSTDPRCWRGQEVKCTKSRARLALSNIRKKLAMAPTNVPSRFVELAREHSDCDSAQRGGDLGKVGLGTLAPALEDVAFSLAEGEISEVFETVEGVHLMLRTA
eukprot:TRINITY_DN61849_c0_g1_i1.p1 TRINITY_DN61849_c0_g1~~TRINITY_DN61849_c0_g1_i1.p1  ORF type:complete len:379 (+),score=65.77 TRINITY_DN61849_c0_g1_i1:71-1138(+)